MYYIRNIYIYKLHSKCICSLDVLTQQMAMVSAKKRIVFITRNPLAISACLKLPFLPYIYCTFVTMRVHTGCNHPPAKAQTTTKVSYSIYVKELRTGVSIDQKDGEGPPFHMNAFWEPLLPSPMCCVRTVFCQSFINNLILYNFFWCYSSCHKSTAKQLC